MVVDSYPRLYYHGEQIPDCPTRSGITSNHIYPITIGIYSLWLITGLAFAIVTQTCYNSVLIFEKRLVARDVVATNSS